LKRFCSIKINIGQIFKFNQMVAHRPTSDPRALHIHIHDGFGGILGA
jgi:hypothetical protein